MTGKKFIARLLLLLALAGLSIHRAEALQLGDTRQEVEARYDTAPLGDHPKGIAIYQWDLWKLEIHYENDVARELIYRKLDPLGDEDINTILNQNGGIANWHPAAPVKNRVWSWQRSDGASASIDPGHDHAITLQGGRMPAANVPETPSSPQAATPLPVKTATATTPAPAPKVIAPPQITPAPKPSAAPVHLSKPGIGSDLKNTALIFIVLAVIAMALRRLFGAGGGASNNQPRNPSPGRPGSRPPPHPRALVTMVPTLETMTSQHFELLMGEVYRRQGYEVEISSGDGADGGVDLHLRKDGALVLAQCKLYLSGKVSVPAVREFFGVIKSENATRGIFINTSYYTMDALEFAAGKELDLELLDREGVKALIASVTRPGENIYDIQPWLAEFMANAVIAHPDCPFCKAPMVLRTSKSGDGTHFWGCPTYPRCQGRRDARMELVGNLVIHHAG